MNMRGVGSKVLCHRSGLASVSPDRVRTRSHWNKPKAKGHPGPRHVATGCTSYTPDHTRVARCCNNGNSVGPACNIPLSCDIGTTYTALNLLGRGSGRAAGIGRGHPGHPRGPAARGRQIAINHITNYSRHWFVCWPVLSALDSAICLSHVGRHADDQSTAGIGTGSVSRPCRGGLLAFRSDTHTRKGATSLDRHHQLVTHTAECSWQRRENVTV